MMDESYVIAVKRVARNRTPLDWVDRLRDIEGVEIVGSGPFRVQIRATPRMIEKLRDVLGDDFHVEPVMAHRRLSDD